MHNRLFAAIALAAAISGSAIAQTPATNPAPAKPATPAAAAPAAPATAPATTAAPATAVRAAPAAIVDINTASAADLQKLKGVGEARAEAIIKGRPYKAKDELVDRKILPKNVYDDVKDQIVARQRS